MVGMRWINDVWCFLVVELCVFGLNVGCDVS
jgi:hypothetical protein